MAGSGAGAGGVSVPKLSGQCVTTLKEELWRSGLLMVVVLVHRAGWLRGARCAVDVGDQALSLVLRHGFRMAAAADHRGGRVPESGTPGFPHFLAARWNAGELGLNLPLNSRSIDPSMNFGSG